MSLIQQIEHWRQEQDYDAGMVIYLKHGRKRPAIRRKLLNAQFREKIKPGHRQRLAEEIQHIYLQEKAQRAKDPDFQPLPPEVSKLVDAVEQQRTAIVKSLESPYEEETELDQLYASLKEKATARALLSNKLSKDDADANCRILDEMAPMLDAIKQIEARIKALKSLGDKEKQQAAKSKKPHVVVRRGRGKGHEEYTLKQLYDMPIEELRKLKKRINDDRNKARQRIEGKHAGRVVKKEETKAKAEKVAAIRDKEWELVNSVLRERASE